MKSELLQKAVTEDTTESLKEISEAAYSLKDLSKIELIQIAQKTNKKLGYKLIEDFYKPRLVVDSARIARAVQANAMKKKQQNEILNLKESIDEQMRSAQQKQNQLYDEIVWPLIENNDYDNMPKAMIKYQNAINHFDVSAFRKVFDKIMTEKEQNHEMFADFAQEFLSIPAYANARNNFNLKVKDILEGDGDMSSKQAAIDSLDFSRTKQHNRVIALFNKLNSFATERNIPEPYPNNGKPFDPQNPMDREIVAEALASQETILENINRYLSEEKSKANLISKEEQFQQMSPSQILNTMGIDFSKKLDSPSLPEQKTTINTKKVPTIDIPDQPQSSQKDNQNELSL